MRKIFLVLALPLMLAACSKSSSNGKCNYTATTAVAGSAEIANLKAWLDANSLTYTQHPSGIFYKVITPGSGNTAVACSDVTVKYSGRITTATTPFNDNITTTFTLGQLIKGWQIGIPLIQKGGSIILYIPPSLGYGAAGGGTLIPPDSDLVFTIELLNVQ